MMQRRWAAGILAVLTISSSAYAVSVKGWSVSTGAGFAKGTLDGTTLDERGRLALAPELDAIFGPEEGIVWDVAPAGEDAAFVALSGPGRVLRVQRGHDPEVWYDGGEDVLITALAADGQGGVFVGSSPSGTILHLSGPEAVSDQAETETTFIWALDTDHDGGVWIGTGVPGGVRRWNPGSAVELVFDSGDDPVRSVLALAPSTLVAGTGGRGRVLRLNDQGSAFVIYDAPEKEIVDLAVNDQGIVFALTAGGAVQVGSSDPAAGVTRTPSNSVSVSAKAPAGEAPPKDGASNAATNGAKPAPRSGLAAPKGGALYRIDRDGDARKIWSTTTEIPFSAVIDKTGKLVVSTGDAGKLYRMDAEGRASSMLRVKSNQASALAIGDGGQIVIGSSSDARVSLLGPGVAQEGTYTSAAIDAGTVADWGRLRWNADVPRGAKVAASVRVGNTAEPDETWTEWMELGDVDAGGDVATEAPPARWMQLRLTLSQGRSQPVTVSRLEAFYTPRNRPPLVGDLKIASPGIVWVRGPISSSSMQGPMVADDPVARRTAASLRRQGKNGAPIRRLYELGGRTVSWTGSDPDGDRLTYLVEIKEDAAAHWFPLVGHLDDGFYSWDGRSMPDGLYRIRVTAVDERDNPSGTALSHRAVSEAFRVDNTRPQVDGPTIRLDGASYEVEFVANDPQGKISAVEIAVDGGEWEPVNPTDGVADSEQENYRIRLQPSKTASDAVRYLRVRVADTVGNLGGDAWMIPEPAAKK